MIGKQTERITQQMVASEGAVRLPDVDVLGIAGRDAAAFLQSQTMNDVRALGDGHWQWNGFLSPKGRVLALFALLRLNGEGFLAVVLDVTAAELEAQLRRFVFRSRVTLTPRDDLAAWGALDATALPADTVAGTGPHAGGQDACAALDVGGELPRQLLLRPGGVTPDPAPDAMAALHARWRALDLLHGLPRLAAAQRDQFTPQMLSLERLRAFSLTKGCYPGQEIVARTHYLGQAKRVAHLLHTDREPTAGGEVLADGSRIGVVASTAVDADGALALVVATPWPEGAALTVDGVPARPGTLLGGLAR